MDKINYLNVGCGNKFHKEWFNVDMTSNSEDVLAANLLNGIPFPDNHFEVLYHSQVLEHIPKEKANDFIRECYRVLKPGGIIRVVVPDLENIVDEYKKFLDENLKNPNNLSAANYDWILLEMYDQAVRNYSGGQMAEYLKKPEVINEKYVIDRIGFVGRSIRNSFLLKQSSNRRDSNANNGQMDFVNRLFAFTKRNFKKLIIKKEYNSKEYKIGKFRTRGEIHMWMYDRYSLSRLLKDCGFTNMKIQNPYNSDISNWDSYELDVKDGLAFDPLALFMEARK